MPQDGFGAKISREFKERLGKFITEKSFNISEKCLITNWWRSILMKYQYTPCLFLRFFRIFGYSQSKLLGMSGLCLTRWCCSVIHQAFSLLVLKVLLKIVWSCNQKFDFGEKNPYSLSNSILIFLCTFFCFSLFPNKHILIYSLQLACWSFPKMTIFSCLQMPIDQTYLLLLSLNFAQHNKYKIFFLILFAFSGKTQKL